MTSANTLVFSGVQPTGNLHLGNYLGAIKNWTMLQKKHPCMFCIVDMHALTVLPDPNELKSSTREVLAAFIASGIDANKQIIFNQSRVIQHTELGWIFSCIARLGWMSRMVQFKDKAGKNRENVSLGLFAYPSLMAADILLYRATCVPVGNDQLQHIELTRDIAQKFNNDYAEQITSLGLDINSKSDSSLKKGFFPYVEALINGHSMRIMSLRDGTKKMSKSDPSDLSRINLIDDADTIVSKIRKAKTDSNELPETVKELHDRPEADNLLGIFAALTNCTQEAAIDRFSGKQFSVLKKTLTELLVEELTPIRQKLIELSSDPTYLDSLLRKGAFQAREKAEVTMKAVRDIVGLLQN